MVLIESERVHDFLADYYDQAYAKNKVFAMRSLSGITKDIKQFIELLENKNG